MAFLPPVVLLVALGASAQDREPGPHVDNEIFYLELSPNSPEQMAAFYEARGFPAVALTAVRNACFITVRMFNKGPRVIWLELDNWRVESGDGEVKRLRRTYWLDQWKELGVPLASQATFGWTLLPEKRNLQPDEPVGGNITLPRLTTPFTLEARFVTGRNRRGGDLVARFENITCAEDAQSE